MTYGQYRAHEGKAVTPVRTGKAHISKLFAGAMSIPVAEGTLRPDDVFCICMSCPQAERITRREGSMEKSEYGWKRCGKLFQAHPVRSA